MVKAWQSGSMSHQTLYENLQQGEIAPVDRTFEEEKELIEDEGGDLGMDIMGAMRAAGAQPPAQPKTPDTQEPESDEEASGQGTRE